MPDHAAFINLPYRPSGKFLAYLLRHAQILVRHGHVVGFLVVKAKAKADQAGVLRIDVRGLGVKGHERIRVYICQQSLYFILVR